MRTAELMYAVDQRSVTMHGNYLLRTAGFAAFLVLAGCATPAPSFPVPPPLPAETIPLPPVSSTQLIWHPGDWAYSGDSYRYEPGRYETLVGHGPIYVFGHWTGSVGQYAWVPGRWQ